MNAGVRDENAGVRDENAGVRDENAGVRDENAGVLYEQRFAPAQCFRVLRASLLEAPVDAIVNAANGMLAHGGGVAALIARAAGPSLQVESDALVRARGPLPTGTAAVTGAGRLPFRGVVHAVGPRRGEGDEYALLAGALGDAFRLADAAGWTSLAFPAVSSGIFAVPLETCARAYLAAARRFLGGLPAPRTLRTLCLCLRDAPVISAVLAATNPDDASREPRT